MTASYINFPNRDNHERPAKPAPPRVTRKPMRKVSKKRAKLNREVGPARQQRKADVGCCMLCREKLPPDQLDCDEIARGYAREACLLVPELTPVLCRACHTESQDWPIAKRIAIIVLFDIDKRCAKYNELRGTAPTHITGSSVLNYLDYSADINHVSPQRKKRT